MSRSIHETLKTLRTAYPSKVAMSTLSASDPIVERLAQKRGIKKATISARSRSKVVAEFKKKKEAFGEWKPSNLLPE